MQRTFSLINGLFQTVQHEIHYFLNFTVGNLCRVIRPAYDFRFYHTESVTNAGIPKYTFGQFIGRHDQIERDLAARQKHSDEKIGYMCRGRAWYPGYW